MTDTVIIQENSDNVTIQSVTDNPVIQQNNTTVVVGNDNSILEIQNTSETIVFLTGERGPQGPQGVQGPPGTGGGGVSDLSTFSLQNTDGNLLAKFTPVYKDTSTTFKRASDQDISKCNVFGIVYDDSIANNTIGTICNSGTLEFTQSVWQSYLGTDLIPGQYYFLYGNQLSTTPDISSKAVVKIGYGVSLTKLHIQIEKPILL